MKAVRLVALIAALILAVAARADAPLDGGATGDASSIDATAPDAATTNDGGVAPVVAAPTAPEPYTLMPSNPPPNDAPPRARSTPLYRSPLFWTSVILGAGAIAAIAAGVGLAATYHSRYALVSF